MNPRRASDPTSPTPAQAYILECRLLRAYDTLYEKEVGHHWHAATRRAAQVAALSGLERASKRNGYAEARLTDAMPELIRRLTLEQQPELAALLLAPDGRTLAPEAELAAVVSLLAKFERNLNYRDEDVRLTINDDGRLKAASMGKLSYQQYELSKAKYAVGPPLELTPWVPVRRPALRAAKRRTPHRRPTPVLRGQLFIWPPLAGGVTAEGGL